MIDEAASIVCGRCGGALGHSPDECDRILTATEEEKLRDRAERAERNFKDLRIESRNNIDALRRELAAERERREAAEAILRDVSNAVEGHWLALDVDAHFARYKG